MVALGGQFPTDYDRTFLAYAESVSAIDYLVRQKGQDALVALVTAYADGLTDDEAFSRALGEDLAAFQAGWLGDLGAAEPHRDTVRSRLRPARCRPAGPGRRRPPARRHLRVRRPRPPVRVPRRPPAQAPKRWRRPPTTGGSSAGPILLVLALVVVGVVAVLAIARRRTRTASL